MTNVIDRIVDCPECHQTCGWCAWYAKNAREAGCGCPPSPVQRRRVSCQWGEALKGTTCSLCAGTEKVRFVGHYERAAGA